LAKGRACIYTCQKEKKDAYKYGEKEEGSN
jgi:hypothetical protein